MSIHTILNTLHLPSDWDDLATGENFALSRRMLSQTERSRPRPTTYLISRDERRGVLVAETCVYEIDLQLTQSPFHRIDLMIDQFSSTKMSDAIRKDMFPSLFVGAHQICGTRVLYSPTVDRNAHIKGLVDHVIAENAPSIMVPFVSPKDHSLRAVLNDSGFIRFPSVRSYVLSVKGSSFEEHISTMSKKRKSEIRRERGKFLASEFEFAVGRVSRYEVARLEELRWNVQRKYGAAPTQPESNANSILSIAANSNRDDCVLLTARRFGEIVAFVFAYEDDGFVFPEQFGIDYSICRNFPIYFELAYYFLIDLCIERGWQFIDYGPGSDEAKMLRGADPLQYECYVQIVNADARNYVSSVIAGAEIGGTIGG